LRLEGRHGQMLLVLLGAVVPTGKNEHERVAALQLAGAAPPSGGGGQGIVREDAARNDVGTHGPTLVPAPGPSHQGVSLGRERRVCASVTGYGPQPLRRDRAGRRRPW